MPSSSWVSVCRLQALVIALASMWATSAWATFGHHRDPDRVRLLSATDAPDPFAPPSQRSVLKVSTAVRKFAGLGDRDDDDEDDCDEDRRGSRNHTKFFELTIQWKIFRGRQSVRVLETTVEVRPPFQIVRHPKEGKSRDTRKFALIPVELSWDGRHSNGQLAEPGTYSWEAEALLTRTHTHHGRTKEKFIDESGELEGTVTISGGTSPPPTITITQPHAGLITRASTVAVTGNVSGQTPLSVKINGSTASVGQSTYAGAASLLEGSNTITAVVTDGIGRTSSANTSVIKDAVAPTISISTPASGSTTIDAAPLFVIRYSDPAPASGINTASLTWQLDGGSLSATSTVGSDQATIKPSAPIAAGLHAFSASISDLAGGSSTAVISFSIGSGKPAPPTVDPTPAATGSHILTLSGRKPENTAIIVNGSEKVPINASPTWTTTQTLVEGSNTLSIQARSLTGQSSDPVQRVVVMDTFPPDLTVSGISQGAILPAGPRTITIQFTDRVPGTGVVPTSLTVALDGQDISSRAVVGASSASVDLGSLGAGGHRIDLTLKDQVLNTALLTITFSCQDDGGGSVPSLEMVDVTGLAFSPHNPYSSGGLLGTRVRFLPSEPTSLQVNVTDKDENPVRTYVVQQQSGSDELEVLFDGRLDSGEFVRQGVYKIHVTPTNSAGRSGTTTTIVCEVYY